MRILITGSRDWADVVMMREVLAWAARRGMAEGGESVTLVHGGARGADGLAGRLAEELGWTVEVHPAEWSKLGKGAGMARNAKMVGLGADVVLAFPTKSSRGTWNAVKLARAEGLPTVVVRRHVDGTQAQSFNLPAAWRGHDVDECEGRICDSHPTVAEVEAEDLKG